MLPDTLPSATWEFQRRGVDQHGKEWFPGRDVYSELEYNKKTANLIKAFCSGENYAQKYQLIKFPATRNFVNWPKDSQKYDYFFPACFLDTLCINHTPISPAKKKKKLKPMYVQRRTPQPCQENLK